MSPCIRPSSLLVSDIFPMGKNPGVNLLTFEHTPVYFRSVIGEGFSMARAATLPQRKGATSLLWDCTVLTTAPRSQRCSMQCQSTQLCRNPDCGARRLSGCDWMGTAGRGREGKVSPSKLGLEKCELRDKTAGQGVDALG